MDLKLRLQRVLQILEDTERAGAMSDLEQDIILSELREAYAEVRFGKAKSNELAVIAEPTVEESAVEPAVVAEPMVAEKPTVEPIVAEPMVADTVAIAEPTVEESAVEPAIVAEPMVAEKPTVEPIVAEPAEKEKNLSTLNSQRPTPKRSALLSLYEDNPTPVLGEQFREVPSVADTITCPKGVAESAKVASLREAIGVADKFLIIDELFDNDITAYETAIDNLDRQASLEDCVIFISENYAWRAQSEGAKLIMKLLQRKFNE